MPIGLFDPKEAAYTQSLVNLPTYDDKPPGYVAPTPKVTPFKSLKIKGIGEIGVNQFAADAATQNAVASAQPESGDPRDQPFYPTAFRQGYDQGRGAGGPAGAAAGGIGRAVRAGELPLRPLERNVGSARQP